MSLDLGTSQAGIVAAKQGRYLEAIELLESFCQNTEPQSKDYLQAQMWLVKAYQSVGQEEEAIALCQLMTYSDHPQVVQWARKILPSLSSAQKTQSDEITKLLEAGNEFLKEKHYSEAVQLLEQFLELCNDRHCPEYSQAQVWLVKAYQGNGQLENAFMLCQELANSDKSSVKNWAVKIIPLLSKAKSK